MRSFPAILVQILDLLSWKKNDDLCSEKKKLRQQEVQKFMCSLPSCDNGEEYSAYTLGMDQPPSAGRIWAPDDKAQTIAWDVSEQDYLLAGFKGETDLDDSRWVR